jgi:hypothetical protein
VSMCVHCCADAASLLSPEQHYVWALNLLTIQSKLPWDIFCINLIGTEVNCDVQCAS